MRAYILGAAILAACCPAWAAAAEPTAQGIADALRDSGQLVDYSLGVKINDGAVLLSGRVASEDQMNTAIELAQQQPGVTRVLNDLEIRPTAESADEYVASDVMYDSEVAPAAGREIRRENLPHPMRGFRGPMTKPKAEQAARPITTANSRSLSVPADPLKNRQANNYAEPPVRRASDSTPVVQRAIPSGHVAMPVELASAKGQLAGHRRNCNPGPGFTPAMGGASVTPAMDGAYMPNHAWPSYATYSNYGAVAYPQQYSATAWPYIGPFYPYPQVPLGWRKVTLEWDDGWWFLDFRDKHRHH